MDKEELGVDVVASSKWDCESARIVVVKAAKHVAFWVVRVPVGNNYG